MIKIKKKIFFERTKNVKDLKYILYYMGHIMCYVHIYMYVYIILIYIRQSHKNIKYL